MFNGKINYFYWPFSIAIVKLPEGNILIYVIPHLPGEGC